METYSEADIRISGIAMYPKDLWCLAFRALLKPLGLLHGLLKKFQKEEHLHEQEAELVTTVGCLPELSQDVLVKIFATLEIPDLLRAGAVCTSWRLAYSSLASLGLYKNHQTPCLIYTSQSAGENVVCLYSLAEQKVYKLTLPDPLIRTRYIIGSSKGWLVTVSEVCEIHLLNPITGQQINLPSVTTIEHVKPIFDDFGSSDMYEYSWRTGVEELYEPSILTADELRERLFYKAFLFSETSTGNCFVVLIHNPLGQLSFARLGDDKWTWLPPYTDYLDCIYMGSLLYAITKWGEIHAFDLSDHIFTAKIIMPVKSTLEGDTSYLTQDSSGQLLHVHRSQTEEDNYDPNGDPMTYERHTGKIEIYNIHIATQAIMETNCLQDHVLFLGHNQTLCMHIEECPSLKANHSYFTDDDNLYLRGYKNNRRDIGVFNMDCDSREELKSPQLWSNWPAPVWITPNISKM